MKKTELEQSWLSAFEYLKKNSDFGVSDAKRLALSPEEDDAVSGYILWAAKGYLDNDGASVCSSFEHARLRFGQLPDVLRTLCLNYHAIIGDLPDAALGYAYRSAGLGFFSQAMEEMRIAFAADYRQGKCILAEPSRLISAMHIYEGIAGQLDSKRITHRSSLRREGKPRIGMLVPNLVDDTVAYSKRVMFYARNIDRHKYDFNIYISEDMAREGGTSYQRAPLYFKELGELGINIFCVSQSLPMEEAACVLADRMEKDDLDKLIMQIDPAMPVAWCAACMARIKLKLHINIGASIFMPGLTYALYDNAFVMNEEKKIWDTRWGEQVFEPRGTDEKVLLGVVSESREKMGIPPGAAVIGVVGNHLDERMGPEYCRCIAEVMSLRSDIFFLVVGSVDKENKKVFFKDKSVDSRVIFAGPGRQVGKYYQIMDVYAAEFPEGGSQALVEAMACGIPVVAMKCGTAHHTSISAQIVGDELAILKNSPDLYKQRLIKVISEPDFCMDIKVKIEKRFRKIYSIKDHVNRVCEMGF